jgi:hypothetical protein
VHEYSAAAMPLPARGGNRLAATTHGGRFCPGNAYFQMKGCNGQPFNHRRSAMNTTIAESRAPASFRIGLGPVLSLAIAATLLVAALVIAAESRDAELRATPGETCQRCADLAPWLGLGA